MDTVKFISNRTINLDSLFTADAPSVDYVDHSQLLATLGYTLEKQIRTWWDICTFQQYLKDNIIMRSLRWKVTPQDSLNDEESTNEWLDFFNGVGFKLQQLVFKRKKQKMKLLELKIADLQTKLDLIKDTPQAQKLRKNLRK